MTLGSAVTQMGSRDTQIDASKIASCAYKSSVCSISASSRRSNANSIYVVAMLNTMFRLQYKNEQRDCHDLY